MALRAPAARRAASEDAPRAPTSLRAGLRSALAYAETRAKLAANEFEEQVLRLLEVALWAAIGLFLFAVGLVFVAFFVVLLFWDSNRLLAAGLVSAVFIAGGAVSVAMVRAGLAARPKFLAATLAEFEKDRKRADGDRQAAERP